MLQDLLQVQLSPSHPVLHSDPQHHSDQLVLLLLKALLVQQHLLHLPALYPQPFR